MSDRTKPLRLTNERYLAALERQQRRIAEGLPLVLCDDNSPGSRSTTATWGLCSDEREAWPDAEDHMWPEDFLGAAQRVAPLYRERSGQACAFDDLKRDADPTMRGCFWRCMLFRPKPWRSPLPTREEAVQLYQIRIDNARNKM